MDDLPEDMTALYDADVPRVDLVGKGANGVPGFLLMKSDGTRGLLDPDLVRDLVAKSKSEPASEEVVTMTGSPAAIAAMIHQAAVRKAEPVAASEADDQAAHGARPDDVEKSDYDTADRKHLAATGAAMDDGSYPIETVADLDDAIRAVGRGGADHDAIRRHIEARAESLGATSKIPDNWAADGSLKKDTGMDMEDLDVTEVMAEPEIDAPGNPTTPGSPAWEAIDAATACKWTAILARARTAVDVLAEREMLEAATADEDDAENAWDLQDACCAIDYAISLLAPFAAGEHAEAEMGADVMEVVGKAVASATGPLEVIEGLAPVRKAGRVLSTANEAAIRGAVEQLQKVLASLPAAPAVADDVAKTANEEPDMPKPTMTDDVTAASGQAPAMGTAEPDPKPEAGTPVTVVGKAEKTPMVVVYDQKGKLIGIVDPADVTPVANSEADPDDMDGTDGDAADAADTEPGSVQPADDGTTPTDMAPAPADAVGTPADATAADDDGNVAKTAANDDAATDDVLKSSIAELVKAALDEHSAEQADLVKRLEDRNRELEERNDTIAKHAADLEKRLDVLENAPAVMAIASNGAVPPAHLLRGQDRGAQVDVTKAQQLRTAFTGSDDARQQKALAEDLNLMAIDKLREIHAAGPR